MKYAVANMFSGLVMKTMASDAASDEEYAEYWRACESGEDDDVTDEWDTFLVEDDVQEGDYI